MQIHLTKARYRYNGCRLHQTQRAKLVLVVLLVYSFSQNACQMKGQQLISAVNLHTDTVSLLCILSLLVVYFSSTSMELSHIYFSYLSLKQIFTYGDIHMNRLTI